MSKKPRLSLQAMFYRIAQLLPFKKDGSLMTSFALALFLLLLAGYLFSGLLQKLEAPIKTVTAVEYESVNGYYSSGYIVRDEIVLSGGQAITALTVSEGQKTSLGQPVALEYHSSEAQQLQQQIAELTEKLTQLQYAAGSAFAPDQATMDIQIRGTLVDAAVLVNRGRMSALREMSPELKGMILRRFSDSATSAELQQQIRSTEEEISALRQQVSGRITTVTAPRAGYFSGTTDGYETVLTPASMAALSVADVENLSGAAKAAPAVGKIITGETWYYVTVLPARYLQDLPEGNTVTVSFAQELPSGSIPMKVHHVGQEENGKFVAIFSCGHYMQDITLMREQSADIIIHQQNGLRVPKEAVRVRDDNPGVYVLEGVEARWKRVTILLDNGETYLVTLDKSQTSFLWPGDEIIVSGVDDLRNGMVIF